MGSRVLRQSGRGLSSDFYDALCNLVCPLDKRAKPDYFSPTEFIMRGNNTPILADYDKGEIIGVPRDKLGIPVVKAGLKRKFAIVMMLRICLIQCLGLESEILLSPEGQQAYD